MIFRTLKILPFKNIAAQIANVFVSNLKVVKTPNFSTKNTDRLKKSTPKNNDKIIFKQLDCYDELLNIQNKFPIYTNNLKPMNDNQLNFYEKYVDIDRDQIFNLMYSTIEQANNSAWRLHRQTRLSASSKAHQINTRRNRNEDLAERFVKDKKIVGKGLKYVEYGMRMEDFALKKYSLIHNIDVIKCGLVVHQKQPWVCASPDGLVIQNNKYSLCLLIFFLLEMGIAIIGFVFPHNMQATLEESFTDKIIHTYRDDPDLQNLIDFAQKEFQCCGLSSEGYIDWSKNEYFNCTSPSVEKCGVPYSCCINATDISKGLVNVMCGYGAQDSSVAEASKRVWTSGCIEVIRIWAERNLYTIAGVALGVALSQLLIINLAKTLEGQIDLQKSRWAS
ncbi:tetraspanin-14-like isoform X2 [Aphis gossypii]|uniref:tetraspanin-14-like isoform X2 n=1 Tax=Aphis gossypii TaxID=80765 RepID=UPI00215900B2|nr:tetraspanin-14-like isoform X2 [Aphis gossypii]